MIDRSFHSLLRRQLRKLGIDLEKPLSPEYRGLIEAVNEAYKSSDADRLLLERSLEISSQELLKASETMRTSRQMLQLVMDNIPQFIFWKDKNSVYMGCNRNFARVAGVENPEDIAGKTDLDLAWAPEEAQGYRAADRRVMDSNIAEHHIIETQLQADGKKAWLDTNKVPLHDASGQVIGILGTYEDITERKRIDEELDRAKKMAEAANAAKTQFLANMSHDLRTPMNAVLGFTELLEATNLNAAQQEYVSMIHESGKTLLTLINDILDISKIESGEIRLEVIEFNIWYLIENVIVMFKPLLRNENVELHSNIHNDVPVYLRGDPTRLRRILSNLIGNAVKFTEKGRINIELGVVSGSNTLPANEKVMIKLVVKDTGIGIPKERQNEIFKAFTQADAMIARKYGGSGLGLAIVRQLCEKMGGTVVLESEPGKGSEFSVVIPFMPGDPSYRPAALSKYDIELIGKKVIIIDSSVETRRLIEHYCMQLGMNVLVSVATINDMQAGVAQSPYTADLIFFGIISSELDEGELAFLARARSDKKLSSAKIIAISDSFKAGDAERCRKLGFNVLIPNPVQPKDLQGPIRMALSSLTGDEEIITRHLWAERALAGARILIAEDNLLNAKLITALLKGFGCVPIVVINGREAVLALQKETYDAVLMDIHMPVMDGIEAAKHIRALKIKTPVIALTASVIENDRDKCAEAGMNDYLLKPIDADKLKETLIKWLSAKK